MHAYPEALVLFAAGNDGPDPYSVDSPSTNKNGVSVGASLTDSPYSVSAAADSDARRRRRQLRGAKSKDGTNGTATGSGSGAAATSSSGTGGGVNSLAFFSSAGPTLDGRRKPDVVGAGWWITSARSADAGDVQTYAAAGSATHCRCAFWPAWKASWPLTSRRTNPLLRHALQVRVAFGAPGNAPPPL